MRPYLSASLLGIGVALVGVFAYLTFSLWVAVGQDRLVIQQIVDFINSSLASSSPATN